MEELFLDLEIGPAVEAASREVLTDFTITDPQAAASNLPYLREGPCACAASAGVQESVTEAEIRSHVEEAVSRNPQLCKPAWSRYLRISPWGRKA